jgi:protein-glutamine gamma-glutamyltransferase
MIAARSPKPEARSRGFTLLQAQRWSGSLAALFAFLGCAVSGEMNVPLLLLFPLALAGAEAFGDRAYGKADWAWTAFLAAALLLFAAMVVSGRLDIVLAAAEFAELLCIHRLWHRRTERDELLLLLLSLLLLCAGAALTAELSFGLAFLGFSVTATWATALTHLRFQIEAGRGPAGSAALLQSKRIATPALLGGLAALAMTGLVGAAVVFFTFPRVTIGGLRRPSHAQPAAGLSDRVDLSSHGTIADDPRVVLRVSLDPMPARNALDLHWRARALEVWTGSGWRAVGTRLTPNVRVRPAPHPQGQRPRPVSFDMEEVAGFSAGVVLTPGPWLLGLDFRRPMNAQGSQPRLLQDGADDFFYQPVDIGDLHYLVRADLAEPPLALLRGRGQGYSPRLGVDLAVPGSLDPRVRALAQQLGAGKDPADAAAAIETWLSTRLGYTRELPGEVADPIADFLFVRKKGHCELFSSAMVLMLRSLGIPARNVTGYYGGTLTSAGYYAVRAGDAHSWVEVFFPGAGFVQFDPTPAGDRGGQLDTLWSKAVLVWDMLQQRWRALVVDYDLVTQTRAMQRLGALISETGKRLSGKAGSAPRIKLALLGLLAAALCAGAVFGLRKVRISRRPRARRLEADRKRALQLWQRARARLRQAGVELLPSTTPREAARRAQVPAARALVAAYLAARWGGAELSALRARELLRALDAELSGLSGAAGRGQVLRHAGAP